MADDTVLRPTAAAFYPLPTQAKANLAARASEDARDAAVPHANSSSTKTTAHHVDLSATHLPPHLRAIKAARAAAAGNKTSVSSSCASTSPALNNTDASTLLSGSASTPLTASTRVKHVFPATAKHGVPEHTVDQPANTTPPIQPAQSAQSVPATGGQLMHEELLQHVGPRRRGPIPPAKQAVKQADPAPIQNPFARPPKIRGPQRPGTYQADPSESRNTPAAKTDMTKHLANSSAQVTAPQRHLNTSYPKWAHEDGVNDKPSFNKNQSFDHKQKRNNKQTPDSRRNSGNPRWTDNRQNSSNNQRASNAAFQKILDTSRQQQQKRPKPRNAPRSRPLRASRWPTKADFPPVPKRTDNPFVYGYDSDAECAPDELNYNYLKHDRIESSYRAAVEVDHNAATHEPDRLCKTPGQMPKEEVDELQDLRNWDGSLGPPPVDWEGRARYNSQNTTANIELWLSLVQDSYPGIPHPVLPTDNHVDGVRAPRSWVLKEFGNQTLMAVWKEMTLQGATPRPVDESDLDPTTPWWTQYQSCKSEFLPPIVQPAEGPIDPCELHADRINRENDYGNLQHVENRRRKEWAKAAALRDHRKLLNGLGQKWKHVSGYEGPLEPALDVYIRPVWKEDLMQVRDIYNFHVRFSTSVPETEEVTAEAIEREMLKAQQCGLPFLVALQRGKRFRNNKWSSADRRETFQEPDKIAGFVFAHNGLASDMSVGEAALKIFTAHAALRCSIAKCLLDKFLALVDPAFPERAGYDTDGLDTGIGTHVTHSTKKIWIEFYHHDAGHLSWMVRWLEHYKFHWLGTLENCLVTSERQVSHSRFFYTISK